MNHRTVLLATVTAAMTSAITAGQGTTPIAIREEIKPGSHYSVVCRVNIEGELVLPEKGQAVRIPVTGKSVIKYDERVLELKGTAVDRTVRS